MFRVLFGITAGLMIEVAIKTILLEAARYDPEYRVVSKVEISEQSSVDFMRLSAILNDHRLLSKIVSNF